MRHGLDGCHEGERSARLLRSLRQNTGAHCRAKPLAAFFGVTSADSAHSLAFAIHLQVISEESILPDCSTAYERGFDFSRSAAVAQ